MFTIALMASCASALAFAVSARAPVADLAIMGIASSFLIQVMFAGFLKNLRTVDDWLAWLEYLSIFRYALNAITVNELDGNDYPPGCSNMTMNMNNSSTFECLVGSEYLDRLGYLDFDIWYNILALVCFNVGFLLLAYVNLRLLKKNK
ncbi:broad substrate specificity ATP-binding cassette transporter ABCG2-like [Dysidea avara]|uniref:broad substrate specificity ATP-binding cassette transporter ABCG2-like n=1 Tax=Dysidea avara TaxID=196820 RepID=UPI003326E736